MIENRRVFVIFSAVANIDKNNLGAVGDDFKF
jgi:hypothetical protein